MVARPAVRDHEERPPCRRRWRRDARGHLPPPRSPTASARPRAAAGGARGSPSLQRVRGRGDVARGARHPHLGRRVAGDEDPARPSVRDGQERSSRHPERLHAAGRHLDAGDAADGARRVMHLEGGAVGGPTEVLDVAIEGRGDVAGAVAAHRPHEGVVARELVAVEGTDESESAAVAVTTADPRPGRRRGRRSRPPVVTSRTCRRASSELSASGVAVVTRATRLPSGAQAAAWTWRDPSVSGVERARPRRARARAGRGATATRPPARRPSCAGAAPPPPSPAPARARSRRPPSGDHSKPETDSPCAVSGRASPPAAGSAHTCARSPRFDDERDLRPRRRPAQVRRATVAGGEAPLGGGAREIDAPHLRAVGSGLEVAAAHGDGRAASVGRDGHLAHGGEARSRRRGRSGAGAAGRGQSAAAARERPAITTSPGRRPCP